MYRRYWLTSECDEHTAFIRKAALSGTGLTTHESLKLMDRCCLFRTTHNRQINGLAGFAPETHHFQVSEAGIERVTEHGRGLRRATIAQHSIIPRFAGKPVGL
jgi:hypothetical protein